MGIRVFVALIVAGLLLAPAPALADGADDAAFLALMNEERAAAGLAPFRSHPDLIDDAARQTAAMMAAGDIYHSSDLASVTTGWESLAENVGYGPTVPKLHNAFMASPSHRANIMGDFDRVGIFSDVVDGRIYVTVIFMRSLPGASVPNGPDAWPLAGVAGAAALGLGRP